MKVVLGMSGGVDSSVAAYLLREDGYEVEGVSFILEERRLKPESPLSTCCSVESVRDAKRTADLLGIGHSMVNLRNEFVEHVIEPFLRAYSDGLTPNPCILCNEHVKFDYLRKIADDRGAAFIATGHYARVEAAATGEMILKKAVDERKDQSYVLYVLKRDILDRLVLPLGGMKKERVREIARHLRLPSAGRPESQEICFVGGRNYAAFFDGLAPEAIGPIIQWGTDRILGQHKGIHRYTIGQRKRLGVATGRPLYVVRIDPSRNAVYVGPKEAVFSKEFTAGAVRWLYRGTSFPGGGDEKGCDEMHVKVKVRSTMKEEPASITLCGSTARVVFEEPQWAPAPGQSAVFYDGDRVIGGGVISEVSVKEIHSIASGIADVD